MIYHSYVFPLSIFNLMFQIDSTLSNDNISRRYYIIVRIQFCIALKSLHFLFQITLKGNGTQGYHVMKNNEAILACYSNNMMLHDEDKTSCFTMGIFRINRNDTISIRHISTSGVRAVFTSNASFFGMIRLGRFTNSALIAVQFEYTGGPAARITNGFSTGGILVVIFITILFTCIYL